MNVSSPQKKVGGAISRLSLRLKEGLDRGLQWEDDATPAGALRVRVDSNFDGGNALCHWRGGACLINLINIEMVAAATVVAGRVRTHGCVTGEHPRISQR